MGKNNILKKIVEILSLKNASKTNAFIIMGAGVAIEVFSAIIMCLEILDDIVIPLVIIAMLLIVWGVVILFAGALKAEQLKEEERRKNREIYKKQMEEKRQQELEREREERKVRDEKMAEISDLWPYGAQLIPVAKEMKIDDESDDNEVVIRYKCLMAQLDWRDDKYILNIFHERIEDKTEYTVAIKPSGLFALKDGQAYRISKERLQLDSVFIVCSKESNSKVGDIIALASSFENMQTIRSAEIPNDVELLEMMQKYHFSMNGNILFCDEYNIAEVLVDTLVETVLNTAHSNADSDLDLMLFHKETCSLFYEFSKINRIADEDYKERIGNEKIALTNYINKHQSYQLAKTLQKHGWRSDMFWPYFSIPCKYFVSLINKGSVRLHIDGCTLLDSGLAGVTFYMPFDVTLWNEVCHDGLLNDKQKRLLNICRDILSDYASTPTVDIVVGHNKIELIRVNKKEDYRVVDDTTITLE